MNQNRFGWLAPIAVFVLLFGRTTFVSAQSDSIWYDPNAFEQAGVIEVLIFDSVDGVNNTDVIAALNQAGEVLYQQNGKWVLTSGRHSTPTTLPIQSPAPTPAVPPLIKPSTLTHSPSVNT